MAFVSIADEVAHVAFLQSVEVAERSGCGCELAQLIASGHPFCEEAVLKIADLDQSLLCSVVRSPYFAKVIEHFEYATVETIATSCLRRYESEHDLESLCSFGRVVSKRDQFCKIEWMSFYKALHACRDPADISPLFVAFKKLMDPNSFYLYLRLGDPLTNRAEIVDALIPYVFPGTQLLGITAGDMLRFMGFDDFAAKVDQNDLTVHCQPKMTRPCTAMRLLHKRHKTGEDTTCSICLDEDGASYRFFQCTHGIHLQCAMGLLRTSWDSAGKTIRCPMCRSESR